MLEPDMAEGLPEILAPLLYLLELVASEQAYKTVFPLLFLGEEAARYQQQE